MLDEFYEDLYNDLLAKLDDELDESKKNLKEAIRDTSVDEYARAEANGNEVVAIGIFQRTRNYTYEILDLIVNGKKATGKCRWSNRPWQRFSFADAFYDAANELGYGEEAKQAINNNGWASLNGAVEKFAEIISNKEDNNLKEDTVKRDDHWVNKEKEVTDEGIFGLGNNKYKDLRNGQQFIRYEDKYETQSLSLVYKVNPKKGFYLIYMDKGDKTKFMSEGPYKDIAKAKQKIPQFKWKVQSEYRKENSGSYQLDLTKVFDDSTKSESLKEEKEVTTANIEIVKKFKDLDDGRIHVIGKKINKSDTPYCIGLGYNPERKSWSQGIYDFKTIEDAEKYLRTKAYDHGYNVEEISLTENKDICNEDLDSKKPYVVVDYYGKEIASFDYPGDAQSYVQKKTFASDKYAHQGYHWLSREEFDKLNKEKPNWWKDFFKDLY